MKKILHIDDHEIVRMGVKTLLLDTYPSSIVEGAGDEATAIKLLKSSEFDLIIMDVQMPGIDSFGFFQYIKNSYPDAKVLIYSMSTENIFAMKFLKMGALGFISKSAGLSEVLKAIGLALKNRRYISDNVADILVSQTGSKAQTNPFEKLSTRELNITNQMLNGKSVTEIATILNIATSTVGTYKSRIFEKLQIKNLAELIEMGREYDVK